MFRSCIPARVVHVKQQDMSHYCFLTSVGERSSRLVCACGWREDERGTLRDIEVYQTSRIWGSKAAEHSPRSSYSAAARIFVYAEYKL